MSFFRPGFRGDRVPAIGRAGLWISALGVLVHSVNVWLDAYWVLLSGVVMSAVILSSITLALQQLPLNKKQSSADKLNASSKKIAPYSQSTASQLSPISKARATEQPILGQPPLVQHFLPDFELDCVIGKGATGVVYQAHRPGSNQRLALKTLQLPSLEGPAAQDQLARFKREAGMAQALEHPHIIRIVDAGEIRGTAYIAMEWVEGHDLTAHIQPTQLLPVKDVLMAIADAASALSCAHAQGIVHRDIKPANLLYNLRTQHLKVADFGVARVIATSQTQTGMVLGTPSYMSPEQLAGHKVEGATDIYSLSVTLFQLLTGSLPFSGRSLGQLMYCIVNIPPPDVLQLRPELPAGIVPILLRGLDKTPLGRYAYAAELAQDLYTLSSTLTTVVSSARASASLPKTVDIEL